MSAQNTFMTAIRASERGAYEYLPKPFDLKELIAIVGRALSEPKERVASHADDGEFDSTPLVGRSPAMLEIYRVLARLMETDLDGDDLRRVRHRQGTGGRALQTATASAATARRCGQHGGDPRAILSSPNCSATARRLHRRQCPRYRPLRAG